MMATGKRSTFRKKSQVKKKLVNVKKNCQNQRVDNKCRNINQNGISKEEA